MLNHLLDILMGSKFAEYFHSTLPGVKLAGAQGRKAAHENIIKKRGEKKLSLAALFSIFARCFPRCAVTN